MKKRSVNFLCNIVNFVLGLLIITMSVIFFLDIRNHAILIPAILCLGGMMNLLVAAKCDIKVQRVSSIAYWIAGVVLQGGAIVSIIKLWRS